ncbi:hypothetical protein Y032_0009g739 [Ancylostoma ceylanicum]|uniref:Uncharacterized protein n=1 Tax=Ancylostoma ceylanicum TaxID=53326 RepID=A0A016VJI7_9BILA|nr:hypothetical protein Y032_0009g739 [Ancylostoma ceylanicum]
MRSKEFDWSTYSTDLNQGFERFEESVRSPNVTDYAEIFSELRTVGILGVLQISAKTYAPHRRYTCKTPKSSTYTRFEGLL